MIKPADIHMEEFNYELSNEKIALFPLKERASSKLLVYKNNTIHDSTFKQLPAELKPGTLLVFNNTKVVRARLIFANENGARIELFCLEPAGDIPVEIAMQQKGQAIWKCLVGNLKRWKSKTICITVNGLVLQAEYNTNLGEAHEVKLSWNKDCSFYELLEQLGKIPLPPYLKREEESSDTANYQTVYAKVSGSVAAPTAGLHFTEELLQELKQKGIQQNYLTLHVGAGTFMPVKADTIAAHEMHAEEISVSKAFIQQLVKQTEVVVPVGTTSLRCLESLYWLGVKYAVNNAPYNDALILEQWECYNLTDTYSYNEVFTTLLSWMEKHNLQFLQAKTRLIIIPGYNFKIASGIITNFHQPCSTLLLLVVAMVGKENWKAIYKHALANNYRFLSFGDGSLLWK